MGNFSQGINNTDLPDKLTENQVRSSRNMWFNRDKGITRREGFKLLVTTRAAQAANSWEYRAPSGNKWCLVLYNDGILVAGRSLGSGGGNFSVVVSTQFSTTQPADAAVGLGKIWFTEKEHGLSSWDETTWAQVAAAPQAGQIEIWRNRVWLGDISNALSSVRASGELDGMDWTNNSRFSTSPLSIPIGGVNDGERVFGIAVGFDELVISKERALYAIAGNDQRDFYVRQISNVIGSIYPQTFYQQGATLKFLSNRGLDSYTPPYTFNFVGKPVRTTLESLSALGSEAAYQTITSQSDWALGISTPADAISSNTVPGDITMTLSTGDTTSINFGVGAASESVRPFFYPSVKLDTVTANSMIFTSSAIYRGIANGSFETSELWEFPSGGSYSSAQAHTGSRSAICGSNSGSGIELRVVPEDNIGVPVVVFSTGFPATPHAAWVNWTVNTSDLITLHQYGRILAISGGGPGPRSVGYTTAVSTSISLWWKTDADIFIDDIYVPPSSGTFVQRYFTSQKFKKGKFTQLTSSYTLNAGYAVQNGSVTWALHDSSDGVNWTTLAAILTTGTIAQETAQPYIRYVASFSAVSYATIPVRHQIDDVTLRTFSTGFYQHVLDLGGDITSYGLFTAVTTSSVTFRVQSSSDLAMEDSQWVAQTVNSTIPQTTYRYLGVQAAFLSTSAIVDPSVAEYTVNWNTGESPPRPFGITHNDDYFLFFSTNTGSGSVNDRFLAYEFDQAIAEHSGINAGGVSLYSNQLTIADAANTGRVYQLELSTDGLDNSVAVPSSVKFRRIGADVDELKQWEKFYFTVSRADNSRSQIFNVAYYLNGSTTVWYSGNIEISTGVTAGSFKSSIPKRNQVAGRFLDIELTDLTEWKPYSIHGVRGYGTLVRPD